MLAFAAILSDFLEARPENTGALVLPFQRLAPVARPLRWAAPRRDRRRAELAWLQLRFASILRAARPLQRHSYHVARHPSPTSRPAASSLAASRSSLSALPLAAPDDAALVRGAVEGHPGAARILWDRHSRLVRGLLRRTIGPDQDVEDLVQEVFLRFFASAKSLREPSALSSFLVGISLRVARSELRRRRIRRWLSLTESGTLPEVEDPGVDHEERQAVRRFYGLLDELGTTARLIFVLRHVEGCELNDVAEHLECSLATVKRRLSRANQLVEKRAASDPLLSRYLKTGGVTVE